MLIPQELQLSLDIFSRTGYNPIGIFNKYQTININVQVTRIPNEYLQVYLSNEPYVICLSYCRI